jgi:hypothetical protein
MDEQCGYFFDRVGLWQGPMSSSSSCHRFGDDTILKQNESLHECHKSQVTIFWKNRRRVRRTFSTFSTPYSHTHNLTAIEGPDRSQQLLKTLKLLRAIFGRFGFCIANRPTLHNRIRLGVRRHRSERYVIEGILQS